MGHRSVILATAILSGLLVAGCGGPPEAGPSGHPMPPTSSGPATGPRSSSAVPRSASPFTLPVTPPTTTTPTAPATAAPATAAPATKGPAQLPRGGRTIFPHYRLVGFAGHPDAPALGRLGVGKLDDRATEIGKVAAPYAAGRAILPVLELIATVVQGSPGRDGMYRVRGSDEVIGRYLSAARKVKGLLLLDIQPGRSDFLTEVKAYEKWLKEPDVGIALDPEWRMGPGQVPMRVYGHTTGKEIDAVAAYLSGIVRAGDLPQKVLVFHQVATSVVRDQGAVKAHPGVAIVKSVDGIGTRAMKEDTYRAVMKGRPPAVHAGFKLFYDEDRRLGPLMTPKQVLALKPRPEYILYE